MAVKKYVQGGVEVAAAAVGVAEQGKEKDTPAIERGGELYSVKTENKRQECNRQKDNKQQ
jgi:hypothetical protein